MQRANVQGPVAKAIWFIESHLSEPVGLEEIADACGVSRFHLVRAFGAATGMPVVRYLRARRLSEAARRLCGGARDILALALEAGYGSHEAFTRAFRDEFGVTPEQCRAMGDPMKLSLTEALRMNPEATPDITPERIVDAAPLLVAGLDRHYEQGDLRAIPAQWQDMNASAATTLRPADECAYGVCHNMDDVGSMDYLAGFAVADFSEVPEGLGRVRIPAGRYAVFLHPGHVSAVAQTWRGIFEKWLPASGQRLADGPSFERYGPRFDPRTGQGGFEIWIPLGD